MKEKKHNVLFVATLATAIGLTVAGFCVPPMGVIDGSVLTAVGELFGFGALAQLPDVVGSGKRMSIRRGDTQLTVGGHDHRAHHDDPPEEEEA